MRGKRYIDYACVPDSGGEHYTASDIVRIRFGLFHRCKKSIGETV